MLLLQELMEIRDFKYSANFCEENIWHLCQHDELAHFSKKVLIVSNSTRNCPFKFQKSINGDETVWWNYHVILLAYSKDSCFIYDFDSTLPVPMTGRAYLEMTFPQEEGWTPENYACFKAIDSADYLYSFLSDRSHMKDSEGKWLSDPPKWPLIGKSGELSLPALLDFSPSSAERIYSLEEMVALVDALTGLN